MLTTDTHQKCSLDSQLFVDSRVERPPDIAVIAANFRFSLPTENAQRIVSGCLFRRSVAPHIYRKHLLNRQGPKLFCSPVVCTRGEGHISLQPVVMVVVCYLCEMEKKKGIRNACHKPFFVVLDPQTAHSSARCRPPCAKVFQVDRNAMHLKIFGASGCCSLSTTAVIMYVWFV